MIRSTPPRKYFRYNGSAILAVVVVCGILSSMMGLASAKVSQTTMNTLGSSKVASQAQHYANSKAELMEGMSYTELASQTKANISGSSFYEEVIVGNETAMPGNTNIKQKTCVVNVYEGSETTPRASLTFKRYSVSSGSSVPAGSIIPWYGNLANIPDGFVLCDGKNGTPDLRDRFLVGAGNAYKLGDIGGENRHALTIDELPAHNHDAQNAIGYFRSRSNTFYDTSNSYYVNHSKSKTLGSAAASGVFSVVEKGLRSEGNADDNRTEFIVKFDGSKMVKSQGLNYSHENRPPYYALYYIMKLS